MSQTISLIDSAQWVNPTLSVYDEGHLFEFHIQDAFNYHGYDAVGGVVLGFRLLQKAIQIFSIVEPQKLLHRRELSLFTAFPGLGARDCFELVTRMVTDGRIKVDTDYSQTLAQEGVQGRFFFEFAYRDAKVQLAPIDGYPGENFIALGKASKQPHFSSEQQLAWRNAKYELANTLLSADAETVIRVL